MFVCLLCPTSSLSSLAAPPRLSDSDLEGVDFVQSLLISSVLKLYLNLFKMFLKERKMQSALHLLFHQEMLNPHRRALRAPFHHGSQQFPTCCGCKGRLCHRRPSAPARHRRLHLPTVHPLSESRSLCDCLKSE